MEKSPDAFRTISEVAEILETPAHVLRFWETRFSTIKPLKRGGGRRYYRPEDVLLLKGIRHLLYDQGYTIKGVQKLLKTNGNKFVMAVATGDVATMEALVAASSAKTEEPRVALEEAARTAAAALTAPFCGPATGLEAVSWLDEPAAARSVALIALRTQPGQAPFGMLVLASGEPQRFASDMATDGRPRKRPSIAAARPLSLPPEARRFSPSARRRASCWPNSCWR